MVRYNSNKKQVKQALSNAEKLTLEAIGKAGEGFVKLNTPVKTGALRDSISYQTDEHSVMVGSTLMSEDYPIYQEKGTSRIAAQPYLHPGIHNNLGQLRKVAERAFKL